MHTSKSLIFKFSDIPFEGLQVKTAESFGHLYTSDEGEQAKHDDLGAVFSHPVDIEAKLMPVASKMDIRGTFKTLAKLECDRCANDYEAPISGDFSTFLMPKDQFSQHDKPGGKVIHGPKRDQKPSRHHSRSKAPVLSDAEGEHEDVSFGAFDGENIDLRPLVREHLILQLPLTHLCSSSCLGLCLRCGENVNLKMCHCSEGPKLIVDEVQGAAEDHEMSPLAQALKQKLGQK